MTTTPMKRAGQLIAHLDTLHQIRDVRQLLLLQLSMRERQDQVALFKRHEGAATLSLIGAQLSPPSDQLSHRAGNVSAAVLLDQLQAASSIVGDEVAFSSGQIAAIVDAETLKIEQSDGLARLDAALLSLVGKLEQQEVSDLQPAAAAMMTVTPPESQETAEASGLAAEPEPELAEVPSQQEGDTPDDAPRETGELVADLPAGRSRRRA